MNLNPAPDPVYSPEQEARMWRAARLSWQKNEAEMEQRLKYLTSAMRKAHLCLLAGDVDAAEHILSRSGAGCESDSEHKVGDRVLVASVEKFGEISAALGGGAYYVRLDSGDVIACGAEVLAPEKRS